MRRLPLCLAAILCLLLAAARPAPAADLPKDAPSLADVQEYVRLFGYREMLEQSANRQLAALLDSVRKERPDVSAETFDIIRLEMLGEIKAASERSARDMAEAFRRILSREDVAYLLRLGQDPRMQRVIRLQPALARDLEGVGERLASEVTASAMPRIAERLKALRGQGS